MKETLTVDEKQVKDSKVAVVDFCGNCRQVWPCGCDDPVQCCGICAGSLTWDCKCTERSGYG